MEEKKVLSKDARFFSSSQQLEEQKITVKDTGHRNCGSTSRTGISETQTAIVPLHTKLMKEAIDSFCSAMKI